MCELRYKPNFHEIGEKAHYPLTEFRPGADGARASWEVSQGP